MSQTKKTDSKETVTKPKKTVSTDSKGTSVAKSKESKPKKKDGRGGNHGGHLKSPVIGMNGFNLKEGDNAKIINLNLELFNLPDIDMHDVNQVSQRISDYFTIYAKYDMKPTVAGMGMALNGMSRQTLWAIANNQPLNGKGYNTNLPPEVSDFIKKAYKFMENSMESYMMAGKVNPVTGIFMAKNHYGYVDKQEHVLTPAAGDSSEYDTETIKARYKEIESHD